MTGFDPSLRHPLYLSYLSKWSRQRDVVAGEDRIKEDDVCETYLPRLSGQVDMRHVEQGHAVPASSYTAYKRRASFLNATGRTVEGLVGAIQRKAPDVEWPESWVDDLEILGYGLESLDELVDETLEEVIGIGRFGILVDMPDAENGGSTDNLLPYVSTYHAETITDWERGIVRGRRHTVRVNLYEPSNKPTTSGDRMLEQYRVLRLGVPMPETYEETALELEEFLGLYGLTLGDFTEGPVYFQELWEEVEDESAPSDERQFTRTSITVPRSTGGRLWREIPWTFFNPKSTKAKPEKPALLDVAVVNLSHYRNSADLEHGLHFTAIPQPWAAGFDFKGGLVIGCEYAWVSPEPNAKAGYLEFTGEGLTAIREQMERKEKQMAALGARLLEEQSPSGGAEAAETVKLRHSGERSALARLALAVSDGWTRTLRFVAAFRGADDDDVSMKLNTDFGTEGLSPQMLNALMEQVVGGVMSWDTYVHNLRKGELYPDSWTQEDEAAAITTGRPGADPNSTLDPKPEGKAPADDVDEDDVTDSEDDDVDDGEDS